MDSLPQELIDKIVPHLFRKHEFNHILPLLQDGVAPSELPPFATISRGWQAGVERITFRCLHVFRTDLKVLQALITPARRKYLKRLVYRIPKYDYRMAAKEVGPIDELHIHSSRFPNDIKELLSVLRGWESAGMDYPLCLKLPIRELASEKLWSLDEEFGQLPTKRSFFPGISYSSSIEYTISCVHSLVIENHRSYRFGHLLGPRLARCFPNLTDVRWHLPEADKLDEVVLDRLLFANALETGQYGKLSTVAFDFKGSEKRTVPLCPPGSLVGPYAPYDILSSSLRVFSQNLTRLNLRGHFHSNLFWPADQESAAPFPQWPHLRSLVITLDKTKPSGRRWFGIQRHGSANSAVEHSEHCHPSLPMVSSSLLESFSKAVARMPVIEHFRLESEVGCFSDTCGDCLPVWWDIAYYSPGYEVKHGREFNDDIMARKLYYTVAKKQKNDRVVRARLRNIGKATHGGKMIERRLEPRTWTYSAAPCWTNEEIALREYGRYPPESVASTLAA